MIKYNEPIPTTKETMFLLLDNDKPLLVTKNIVVAEKLASEIDNSKIIEIPLYTLPQGRAKGEYGNNSPLCNEDVIEIFYSNEDAKTLSQKYHVCKSVVSAIKNGKTWQHITLPLLAKKLYDTGFQLDYKIGINYDINKGLRLFNKYFTKE